MKMVCCDHCGKVLNAMTDHIDIEMHTMGYFERDLCDDCLKELDKIIKEYCKKGGE